jgi:predicted dehydrogenase
LVGCGRIAPDHLTALWAAGFTVTSVTARPGSARAVAFAREHEVTRVHTDVAELAESEDWDVAVVATPAEATVGVAGTLLATGRPLLVEKPAAVDAMALEALRPYADALLVAYNRRFYAPVRRAKELLQEHGAALVELALPERIPGAPDDQPRTRQFVANSVHGLDLLRYLVGPVRVARVEALGPGGVPGGFGALLNSERGDVVQLTCNWNAPDNFRLACSWSGTRYELRPFEVGRRFEGMDIVEPSTEEPVRRYIPRLVEEIAVDPLFKPGFVEQAGALAALARGALPGPAARLDDAVEALRLARALLVEAEGLRPGAGS